MFNFLTVVVQNGKRPSCNTIPTWSLISQDPNADTEWNDILRKKGVLPPKEKTQDEVEEEALEKQILLEQESVGKRWLVKVDYLYGTKFLLNWSRENKFWCYS